MAVSFNENLLSDYSARVVLSGISGIWDPITRTLHVNTRQGDPSVWTEDGDNNIIVHSIDDDEVVSISLEDLNISDDLANEIPVLLDIVFPEYTNADIQIQPQYQRALDKNYIEGLGKIIVSSTGCILAPSDSDSDLNYKENFVGREAWERYILDGMDYLRRDEYPILNEYGGIKLNHDIRKEYTNLFIYSPGATKYEMSYEYVDIHGNDSDISGFRLIVPRSMRFVDFYGLAKESVFERNGFEDWGAPVYEANVPIMSVPGITVAVFPGRLSTGKWWVSGIIGQRILLNPQAADVNIIEPATIWVRHGTKHSNSIYLLFEEE